MYLKRDSLGRAEIMGCGEFVEDAEGGEFLGDEMGFILSKAENVANISAPQPIKYAVTVYQQRRRRFGGAPY